MTRGQRRASEQEADQSGTRPRWPSESRSRPPTLHRKHRHAHRTARVGGAGHHRAADDEHGRGHARTRPPMADVETPFACSCSGTSRLITAAIRPGGDHHHQADPHQPVARRPPASISRSGCSWRGGLAGSGRLPPHRHRQHRRSTSREHDERRRHPEVRHRHAGECGADDRRNPAVVTVSDSACDSRAPAISLSQRRPVIQRMPKPIPNSARAPTSST